jgi:aspartyl-tRNA(Asn)/glutamyl-tRNA(Gln) amidotransferase subunit B
VLTADPALADYFELVAMKSGDASLAANWIKGEVLAALNDAGLRIAELSLSAESLAKLIKLVRAGSVSNSAARRIFGILVRDGGDPGTIADREGLRKVGDQGALSGWIDEVLRENPAEAERFRQGEAKLRGVLVGLVMKKSRGSADPKVVNQLLSDKVKG